MDHNSYTFAVSCYCYGVTGTGSAILAVIDFFQKSPANSGLDWPVRYKLWKLVQCECRLEACHDENQSDFFETSKCRLEYGGQIAEREGLL